MLEGELDLLFRDTTFRGGPGSAVYLPRGAIHTFKNNSNRPVKFVIFIVPANFVRFAASAGCACADAQSPPPATEADFEKVIRACAQFEIEMHPEHQAPNAAPARGPDEAYWVLGAHVTLKLTSQDTAGHFSVAEVTCLPGGGVPPHSHREMDEVFHILSGKFEFTLSGKTVQAGVGDTVYVPRGTLHGFRSIGAEPARLLDVHTPGGFEEFFREAGTKAQPDEWKNGTPAPIPPQERVVELIQKHGMDLPRQ